MRGKVRVREAYSRAYRITPAYAGKSSSRVRNGTFLKDHPRLCGEKSFSLILSICGSGSPPPMRGKGFKSSVDAGKYRITPAYAGKSLISSSMSDSLWDHPRLCGEKTAFPWRKVQLRRITPAYAGKSWEYVLVYKLDRDHPRLCGEKFRIHLFITCQPGSPPPMRGKEYRTEPTFPECQDHPRLCGEKSIMQLKFSAYLGSPPPMRGKAEKQRKF